VAETVCAWLETAGNMLPATAVSTAKQATGRILIGKSPFACAAPNGGFLLLRMNLRQEDMATRAARLQCIFVTGVCFS
jgi:hypothetical protein